MEDSLSIAPGDDGSAIGGYHEALLTQAGSSPFPSPRRQTNKMRRVTKGNQQRTYRQAELSTDSHKGAHEKAASMCAVSPERKYQGTVRHLRTYATVELACYDARGMMARYTVLCVVGYS